jgi:hypothetical protein
LPKYFPFPTVEWPCPPASVIKEIDAEVPMEFITDPTAGTLACRAEDGSADLTVLQARNYQALYLMKRLEFDAPLPWTDQTLWKWFVGEVRGIRFTSASVSFCCNPPRVINVGGGTSHAPASSAHRNFPEAIFGLVHEARHADSQHPHTCYGPANGSGNAIAYTRDKTITELGAFGVQYYLGIWISDHLVAPVLTADERKAAHNASDTLATSAFCACGGF